MWVRAKTSGKKPKSSNELTEICVHFWGYSCIFPEPNVNKRLPSQKYLCVLLGKCKSAFRGRSNHAEWGNGKLRRQLIKIIYLLDFSYINFQNFEQFDGIRHTPISFNNQTFQQDKHKYNKYKFIKCDATPVCPVS